MKKDCLILLESGNKGLEVKVLSQKGYNVILVSSGMLSMEKENIACSLEYICDKKIVDLRHTREIISRLNNLYNIKGIFSSSDFFAYQSAILSKELGLLGNNYTFDFTDKYSFRKKQQQLGYKYPEYFRCTSLEDGKEVLKNNRIKFVFKPVNGNESVGVKLIESINDLERCYDKLLRISRYTNGLIKKEFILEQYISGEVYSCEFIKDAKKINILGITNRIMSTPPYFIELGYTFPYRGHKVEVLTSETIKFINDFEYQFGPGHIEYIVSDEDDSIYILEMNPRLVGWPNYWMINKTLECDILGLLGDLYTKGEFCLEIPYTNKTACCLEITSPLNGYFIGITYPEKFKSDNVNIIVNVHENQFIHKPTSNTDIVARVLVCEDNYERAQERIFEVFKSCLLDIRVQPELIKISLD